MDNNNNFTRFAIHKPPSAEGKWRIKSTTSFYGHMEGDVIIYIRKGIAVDEANHALFQVAMMLKEKSDVAKNTKAKLKGIVIPGWITRVFNLPGVILKIVIDFARRYIR